jgi:hypothetical protein
MNEDYLFVVKAPAEVLAIYNANMLSDSKLLRTIKYLELGSAFGDSGERWQVLNELNCPNMDGKVAFKTVKRTVS